ncbi:MAG: phosphonoacetaldehyde hydrolase [Defluviitaleaceae bacterium]|nr:phosphonoacetaldehyde hydrolase [Defluviitaleaceae bacterium]MCL2262075.1 phosphonoacetaldehyde hydrolase [Defluviitaleaceae bacterium]
MKINAIILDWAGTTVDYGCFAPVNAFIKAFEAHGIFPTMYETRAPMGMEKRAHAAKMLEGERLAKMWLEVHGAPPTDNDINSIYGKFEPNLFATLNDYTDPLPGVLDAVAEIRKMGIKIGSTTGYTAKMMDVVVPAAKAKGYSPDCLICPEDVGSGRPNPYMIWHNLQKLGVGDIRKVVKIGDTIADMDEGVNAGCICVGVLKGSSLLGLSEDEVNSTSASEMTDLLAIATRAYKQAGADHVISDMSELPALLKSL